MTKDHYLYLRTYLASHKFFVRTLDFFAGQVVYAYVALPFLLIWFRTGRAFIALAGAALIVSWGMVVHGIALLLPCPRPYQKFKFIPLAGKALFSRVDTRFNAFPSGHTTAIATLTLVIGYFSVPLALISGVVLLFTALSRILLGYHYPQDVIGGFVIASVVVYMLQFTGVFGYILRFVV